GFATSKFPNRGGANDCGVNEALHLASCHAAVNSVGGGLISATLRAPPDDAPAACVLGQRPRRNPEKCRGSNHFTPDRTPCRAPRRPNPRAGRQVDLAAFP